MMTNAHGGRHPAPTALKVLKGERQDRINQAEPRPDPGDVPEAPDWVSAGGRVIWDRLAPQLHEKGVFTDWDVEPFAAYCEAVIHHRDACIRVDQEGVLVKGERGLVKNPALQIVRDNAQILRGLAQEFGLTPSARSGITLPADEEFEAAKRLLS